MRASFKGYINIVNALLADATCNVNKGDNVGNYISLAGLIGCM